MSAVQSLGVSSRKNEVKQEGEDVGGPTGDKEHEQQGWWLNFRVTLNKGGIS